MIVSMTSALLALMLTAAPADAPAASDAASVPTTPHQLPTYVANSHCFGGQPDTQPHNGPAMPHKGGPECPLHAISLSTHRQGLDITVVAAEATVSSPTEMKPATPLPVEQAH